MLADMLPPFWDEIWARTEGPLHFRFILQPAVAIFLAVRDGYRDAVSGRAPYLQDILYHPDLRGQQLKDGFRAVARVIVLGVVMDAAYQLFVVKAFRPVEMLVVVLLLAFVPYLLMRGPARRIFHRYLIRRAPKPGRPIAPRP